MHTLCSTNNRVDRIKYYVLVFPCLIPSVAPFYVFAINICFSLTSNLLTLCMPELFSISLHCVPLEAALSIQNIRAIIGGVA